jgi:XTP/dITP diphosphohydrolase
MDLLLATGNVNKTREFAQILGNGFRISDLTNLENWLAPRETGRTFGENAALKAVAVSRLPLLGQVKDRPVFVMADDSGLEVDALDGAPGIFSARYAGEHAIDKQNIEKLLRELTRRNVPLNERSARFRCVIALARDGKLLGTFQGAVEGAIVDVPRGNCGFGYDPVFLPDGFGRTFGEMPVQLKNQISHRAKAIAALRVFLRSPETARGLPN